MYKDKEKQRTANKLAKQRSRAKNAGMTQNRIIDEIKTHQDNPQSNKSVIPDPSYPCVIPSKCDTQNVIPNILNYGLANCACWMCQTNRRRTDKLIINHGAYKPADQLVQGEVNRVSLPGDVDYTGTCNPDGDGGG